MSGNYLDEIGEIGLTLWVVHPPKFWREFANCNALICHATELESYPNHPRIQQVFCLKSKKAVFVLRFAGGTAASGDVLLFFGHFHLALDLNPLGNYFGLKFFWKLGQNPHLYRFKKKFIIPNTYWCIWNPTSHQKP